LATSGVSTFNATRQEIIRAALRKLGVIDAGVSPDAQTMTDAAFSLNAMIKRWQARGIHVWTTEEATLFLQPGEYEYDLGSSSTDHATRSYVATTLSAAEAAGQTILSITSATGISSGDNIGVVLDSGSIHWSTVSGAPGATVTIAAALPSAAASGNAVYAYTSKIVRPLKIVAARRYVFSTALETDLGRPLARLDYRALPNKTQRGTVSQFFYDPRGGATALGRLHLWPAPSAATEAIKFTWHRPIEDMSSQSDNPDLPQEWIDTMVFNLAVSMAPEYSVPPATFAMVKGLADEYLDTMSGLDREPESIDFGLDHG